MPLLPQGFLDKLLDKHDGLSKELLKDAVFYVVRRLFSIRFPALQARIGIFASHGAEHEGCHDKRNTTATGSHGSTPRFNAPLRTGVEPFSSAGFPTCRCPT